MSDNKCQGGLRKYECEFYTTMVPPRHCLFCKHNTDVIWDYTNGPYMFVCDVAESTEKGDRGECPHFSEANNDVDQCDWSEDA